MQESGYHRRGICDIKKPLFFALGCTFSIYRRLPERGNLAAAVREPVRLWRLVLYLIFILTTCFFPLPSVAMAVIFTVLPFPAFFVFTLPEADTMAYSVLLLVH